MATITKWTPFGVALDITATAGTVTRTSATQFTVKINASWETYYSGAQTNYGMLAASGGGSATINTFGTKASSGSGSFTGTYSISGNGAQTKTITVTFRNFNNDNGDSATKTVSLNVSVPALTSYQVKYNANGGSGAPSAQTKWKDQTLTLSTTKPTRIGYTFQGWGTSASDTTVDYAAGANYTANAAITLCAIWKAKTYEIKYHANGGTGAPAGQTKTYGTALTLSSTKPTRMNYTFAGWAKTSTATVAAYQAGSTYTEDAAVTFYAVWELAYTKPRIKNLTAARDDAGIYALVSFEWECDKNVSSITVEWWDGAGLSGGSAPVTASGTSGTVSAKEILLRNGEIATDTTYNITVKVTDGGGSSSDSVTLPSMRYSIDVLAGGNGVAFGKTAELENYADFGFATRLRENVHIGNKTGWHDGQTGVYINKAGYMQIQRESSDGNPYIALYLDDATDFQAAIALDKITQQLKFQYAEGFRFENKIIVPNNIKIVGIDSSGTEKECFNALSGSNETVVGAGNYSAASGNTSVRGNDVAIWSAAAGNANFRPYYRKGDSFSTSINTAGYITNGSKDITFTVPLSKPVIGSPTVTVSGSLTIRQETKYTHGSSATASITPDSFSAQIRNGNFLAITAVESTITNVTNNDSAGIYAALTITFS